MPRGVPVEGINPVMLEWARSTLGLSINDVAEKTRRAAGEIEAWEAGESAPTYAQLEKLAYSVYKRPIAVFFLAEAPEEPSASQAFRTLPGPMLDALHADTLMALREATAFQASLEELQEGRRAQEDTTLGLLATTVDDTTPIDLAARVRANLGITVADQLAWTSPADALDHWRDRVENAGVFVFKRSFDQREVVGFSLNRASTPLIVLNNGHAKARQVFTLFHELGHILTGGGSLTVEQGLVAPAGEADYWRVERYCNVFASHTLIPSDDFREHIPPAEITKAHVSSLANRYKVSREAIARRYLDLGLVQDSQYAAWAAEFNREYEASRRRSGGGGDYYRTRVQYLGTNYLALAFESYYGGRVSYGDLAAHLGVKPKNLPGLEAAWLRKVQAT